MFCKYLIFLLRSDESDENKYKYQEKQMKFPNVLKIQNNTLSMMIYAKEMINITLI